MFVYMYFQLSLSDCKSIYQAVYTNRHDSSCMMLTNDIQKVLDDFVNT